MTKGYNEDVHKPNAELKISVLYSFKHDQGFIDLT